MSTWSINENPSDLMHHGVKGQKWHVRRKKQISGKSTVNTQDKQMSNAHKKLGKMNYSDTLKYYKYVSSMSNSALQSWLNKHKTTLNKQNISINANQYRKYVLNAANKAKTIEEQNKTIAKKDLGKNISNRARGLNDRVNNTTKFEKLSELTAQKKVSSGKTTNKPVTKNKTVTKKVEPKKVERKPLRVRETLSTATRRNRLRKSIRSMF